MGSVGFRRKGNRKMASDAADGKPFGRPFVLWREQGAGRVRSTPAVGDSAERESRPKGDRLPTGSPKGVSAANQTSLTCEANPRHRQHDTRHRAEAGAGCLRGRFPSQRRSRTPPPPAGSVTERSIAPRLGGHRFSRQRNDARTWQAVSLPLLEQHP